MTEHEDLPYLNHILDAINDTEESLRGFTKEQFLKEENEDVRGGMYEIIESKGEGSMLTFLDAIEIDKQSFVHSNGEIEEMILYKTKESFNEEEDLNGKCPADIYFAFHKLF